jgi:hypothetical protein
VSERKKATQELPDFAFNLWDRPPACPILSEQAGGLFHFISNAPEDTAVRYCEESQNHVYYCNDIEETIDDPITGECVTPDRRRIRDNDLERPHWSLLGKIARDYSRRRIEEDRAAAEREYGRPRRERRQ